MFRLKIRRDTKRIDCGIAAGAEGDGLEDGGFAASVAADEDGPHAWIALLVLSSVLIGEVGAVGERELQVSYKLYIFNMKVCDIHVFSASGEEREASRARV